jgi:hypothetical protein
MATIAQRQHVKHLCDVFKAHSHLLLYPPGDVRTALEWHDWHLSEQQLECVLASGGQVMLDCSDTASWWFKCAGLWPFSNPGFTGTWFDWLGRHAYTDAKQAELAAPVIFGPRPGHHMGVVYKPDPTHGNPLIAGHGRPGFDIAPLSQVAASQPPGITFLSIAGL